MDYLRTLGSAAVSTLVAKSGLNLPFSLGSKVNTVDTIYTLYEATKRDDGSPVSVFEFDFTDASKRSTKPLALNALRKLRTTRHPDVLKFMDAVESDALLYIMTERVRPLPSVLPSWASKTEQEREDWLLWGLHRISIALTFINDSCTSTHGNINAGAVFISPSGEWKLGGFEVFSNPKDEAAVLYTMGGLLPGINSISPPEVKKGGWPALKSLLRPGIASPLDLQSNHPRPATAEPPHPPPPASSRGSIPLAIFPLFKRLLNPNPGGRATAKHFLEVGMAESGFFAGNRLVKVCTSLDNFALSSDAEKATFLRTLSDSATSFPSEFATKRLLPSLLSALEYGGASAASIVPLVLRFGVDVTPEEYTNVIIGPLIKLYSSPDRGTRMALLDHLPSYIDKLDKKTVSDKIFPPLQTGFSDTVAIIREATVKSMSLFAPKPSIRTNTCILLGRLGPTLGFNTKRKVLVPAFARALKDSFVHARVAGIMAFMATIDCFEIEELATKVIPNISFSLVDKEKLVRDQAFKALDIFVKKLETHAATMPETAANDPSMPEVTVNTSSPATLVNSAAGAAGTLAGWAISSLGKKLAASDMQTTIAATQPINPSAQTPVNVSFSAPPTPALERPMTSKVKAMQLGSKSSSALPTHTLADELAEEISAAETANAWGSDDLIDVNADADDWTSGSTMSSSSLSSLSTSRPASKSPVPKTLNPMHPKPRTEALPQAKKASLAPAPQSLTKEEKSAEMARRKEERRLRIALLKEQKKGAGK
ncbi:other/SCY1 protein kinase [Ephemerocybe angulata]|uniref:Other/SCY1 protein kinase n=1 Tax=Ephemerocybe angulata TaxID=980116 RepID=A0A8H6M8S5_9AGAR|nr:other/SCY1 protein kinase [Tulosesus angulatus]